MRVAVVGLGGVGGYFGGYLARYGQEHREHEVCFLARGKHLQAIQEKGLLVKGQDQEFVAVPALATDKAEAIGPVDVVLFCTKGYDLEATAEQIRPIVQATTVVIPLLNGVDNAERLQAVLPEAQVVNGCCYIFSWIAGPGEIVQSGPHSRMVFGLNGEGADTGLKEKLQAFEALCKAASIRAKFTTAIEEAVWMKYLMICAMGGATAYYGEPVGEVRKGPEKRALLTGLLQEIAQLAQAKGIALAPDAADKTLALIDTLDPASTTSLQRDVAQGHRTEIGSFSGYVVRAAEALGLDVPAHRQVLERLGE
ncbi:ketopantoate reductase family protein [Heliophilum fasciatum]|uniref:2-dehydropantoate 2-reductase n=1 Tax=Heliophilum fasciatum TaxID=35700 RepID=A0A4R2RJE4_9FIRM|nr:2-dehydropantoate 2-reductase [Heliophilum fasciatum]MCW2278650.1 2-dehydropantoate 2-reductase [Heliophilum fasciatum]TCP62629.1 ketopantoate reductase [Heliophilum fasciatum]